MDVYNVIARADRSDDGAYRQGEDHRWDRARACHRGCAEHNAAAGDQLMFDWYGGPRPIDPVAALDKAPSAYSLDNFGSFLYAMTECRRATF